MNRTWAHVLMPVIQATWEMAIRESQIKAKCYQNMIVRPYIKKISQIWCLPIIPVTWRQRWENFGPRLAPHKE
jgi:hypothetical protein